VPWTPKSVHSKPDLDLFSRLRTICPHDRYRLADKRTRYGNIDRKGPNLVYAMRPDSYRRSVGQLVNMRCRVRMWDGNVSSRFCLSLCLSVYAAGLVFKTF